MIYVKVCNLGEIALRGDKFMDFNRLNPVVREAAIYEKITNIAECRAYDARLFYLISGDVTVGIEDEKKFHLSVGNLLYVPAGVRYSLKGKYLRMAVFSFDLTSEMPLPEEKMLPSATADFKSELAHVFERIEPFDKVMRVEDAESERDKIIKMCNTATAAEGQWRAELSAELKLLLLKLAETALPDALPARMVEALDEYIRENASEEISNTEIGAIFGYHPFYVSRMLKEKKGITMRQYVIAYRLKAAKRLLRYTDKAVADIADECGFTDASYFAKTFKASFGISPKDYRSQFNEGFI